MVDAAPGRWEFDSGRLELLLDVARAQAELDTAVGQLVDGRHVAGEQHRVGECRVEDEGPDAEAFGGGGGRRERRPRARDAQVVRDQQDVEAELFDVSRAAFPRRAGVHCEHVDPEPERPGRERHVLNVTRVAAAGRANAVAPVRCNLALGRVEC